MELVKFQPELFLSIQDAWGARGMNVCAYKYLIIKLSVIVN